MKENKGILHNWSITLDPRDPYLAPELRNVCIQADHPGYEARHVLTSSIQSFQQDPASKIFIAVETRNSWYTLGNPDPKWVAFCEQYGGVDEYIKKSKFIIKDY